MPKIIRCGSVEQIRLMSKDQPCWRSEKPATYRPGGPESVTMFSDGATIRNPGRGGYGVTWFRDGEWFECSEGYRLTTNNRMEVLGALAGLEALEGHCKVDLFSDSQYLVNAISKGSIRRRARRGWTLGKTGGPVKNQDLWLRMLSMLETHEVNATWIRGHSGLEENEWVDELANRAAAGAELLVDAAYESTSWTPTLPRRRKATKSKAERKQIRREVRKAREATQVLKKANRALSKFRRVS